MCIRDSLKADIELISVTAEELSSITATIASEEAYATQGIEKPASHNTDVYKRQCKWRKAGQFARGNRIRQKERDGFSFAVW